MEEAEELSTTEVKVPLSTDARGILQPYLSNRHWNLDHPTGE